MFRVLTPAEVPAARIRARRSWVDSVLYSNLTSTEMRLLISPPLLDRWWPL